MVFPKSYYYHFYALFLVMLSAWILLAVITVLLGLITYFSTNSLPTPTSIEITVMLVITLVAAFKLKHVEIITLNEEGLAQAGTFIPYNAVSRIEVIEKWYLRIVVIYSPLNDNKSIMLIAPTMLKNHLELLQYISDQTGHPIRL